MVINIIQRVLGKEKGIIREDDLKPRGVKYTIRGDYDFNETFQHIFRERLKS
jgi:hypothetical protein